ncbi:MAG: tRNA lysidine(34) synthetase TilS [Candidatus Gracilibacteria bacterium]|jgi:tRNA(Ile)-lysidine synthase
MNQQESKKLEDKLLEILKTYLLRKSTIILGVSGGPDSIFLLYILQKLIKTHPVKIIIAHVNHMLRGIESNLDEKFIKALAKEENHTVHILKKDIGKLSKTLGKGLEETGREIRYEFFKELARKNKANYIITAHQADDNLETVIMNLVRGASMKGLSGMKDVEKLSKNLKLLRPLLNISKKQIMDYLKTKKIPFRIDKSNKDTVYRRNFIRHKIIPSLKKLNPNLVDTVAKNTKHFREIIKLLEEKAVSWLNKNSLNKTFTKFGVKSFRKQPKTLQKEIILRLYEKIIGNTKDIETPHIDEVLKIINSGLGNKEKRLGKLLFRIKNNILDISKSN